MPPLKILIADDHEAMREGMRALIEREPGWQVCATAANGMEAVAITKKSKPDVVVLDMTMPELDGLEALRQIKRASPNTEVVVYSAHHSEDVIKHVFAAGAKSYIQKSDAGSYLITAIRSLAEHRPFFTNEISEVLFAKFSSRGSQELTAREREIARLLAGGSSNKQIAHTLGISVRTAETHRATLMHKIGVDSLAGLVRYAIRNNIVEP